MELNLFVKDSNLLSINENGVDNDVDNDEEEEFLLLDDNVEVAKDINLVENISNHNFINNQRINSINSSLLNSLQSDSRGAFRLSACHVSDSGALILGDRSESSASRSSNVVGEMHQSIGRSGSSTEKLVWVSTLSME